MQKLLVSDGSHYKVRTNVKINKLFENLKAFDVKIKKVFPKNLTYASF